MHLQAGHPVDLLIRAFSPHKPRRPADTQTTRHAQTSDLGNTSLVALGKQKAVMRSRAALLAFAKELTKPGSRVQRRRHRPLSMAAQVGLQAMVPCHVVTRKHAGRGPSWEDVELLGSFPVGLVLLRPDLDSHHDQWPVQECGHSVRPC